MKVIAHRGWSQGDGENTMEFFTRTLGDNRVEGVELDIWGDSTRGILVTHNRPEEDQPSLPLQNVLNLFQSTTHEIFIECKMFSESTFQEIITTIKKYHLERRAVLFGFPEIARLFPWDKRDGIRLGIISKYPWNIKRDIETYNPDTILFGWNTKSERLAFKIWWSVFSSISKIVKKYPQIKFVAGVMFNEKDRLWLEKQGIYAATADKPFVWK